MRNPRSKQSLRLALAVWVALPAFGCKSITSPDSSCVVNEVSVTPDDASVTGSSSVNLQAALTQTGCADPNVFWSSSDTTVARVSQSGVVTGIAVGGPVTIAASSVGRSGSATIVVVSIPVARIDVTSPRTDVLMGRTLQLTAIPRDEAGNALTGRPVTWRSSNTALATVSSGGLVTGVAAGGPLTITATSEGKSASIAIRVVGRLAYALVTDPASSLPATVPGSTFSSSGLTVTVARTAAGAHTVRFAGQGRLAGRAETVVVNAVGGGNARCFVGSWTTSGTDLVSNVICVTASGSRQDTPFSILLVGEDAFGGRTAFARAHNATATSPYSPLAGLGHNPTRQAITITAGGRGQYTVSFVGNGRTTGSLPETILVSPYGSDKALCVVDSWSTTSATVNVRCADALGVPLDSEFTILMVERGRAGVRAAHALVNCGAASACTPPSTSQYSTGGTITATHTANGVYQVTFPDLARGPGASDVLFVSAVSPTGGLCKAVSWSNALNGRDLQATVQCYGPILSLGNLAFDVVLIE